MFHWLQVWLDVDRQGVDTAAVLIDPKMADLERHNMNRIPALAAIDIAQTAASRSDGLPTPQPSLRLPKSGRTNTR